ncbi:MAG: transmembrane 220 family protein [Saprospiraceae bacterium]
MKNVFWTISVVFLLFALVQYNDPDPLLWMLLYGGIAAHFAMAALGRTFRPAIWLWLGGALAWTISLSPDFIQWLRMGMPSIVETMKAEAPWVELAREFLGLLIASIACGWLLWRTR